VVWVAEKRRGAGFQAKVVVGFRAKAAGALVKGLVEWLNRWLDQVGARPEVGVAPVVVPA
jgi:hypothetical protein